MLAVQLHARPFLGWDVVAYGSKFSILVRPPAAAALSAHMKPPASAATANQLLSPMPGTLLSVAVEAGAKVHAGQDLCVVEAMKMQNVLAAPRDGVVKELLASAGATLSADQPILSFEEKS